MIGADAFGGKDGNRWIYETRYSARNYAAKSDGDDVFSSLAKTRLSAIRAVAPRGARVLDLCCGSGEAARPLAREGRNVVGLDFSGPILDELRALWTAERGDPAAMTLRRADARSVPEPDASFDALCCFAALYHVAEATEVFAEIARVLRPGGKAVIEIGSDRSLNAIEAKRVETGVASFHLRPTAALRALARCGLAVVEDRAFQLFPCWGGGTPRATHVLNPLLSRRLAVATADGRTLDEVVSSSPLLRPFAFRRLLVLERTSPQEAERRLAERRAADRAAATAALTRPREAGARARAAADRALDGGRIAETASLRLAALALDPFDYEAALGLAELFDGVEEKSAVAKWRTIASRSRAIAESSARRAAVRPAAARPPATNAPMKQPDISVVLPTFNQADFLPASIASILAQTFTAFELIVVDDGSTDGTASYLATLRDPRVRVIRRSNGGLPSALNLGFSEARGAYFTWTSSDNLCAPAWLEALHAALKARPECGMAVGGFSWIDEHDRIRRLTRDQDVSPASFLTRNPGNAAFLYRADLAKEIGGYEPALLGAEDWDYWVRLSERAPVVRVDAILYHYREHAASMTATIPARIAEASKRVVVDALERRGETLELNALYPWISACADVYAAETDAAFDLGVRVLKSPWCDPTLAVRCFDAALVRAPESGMAAANLALALARCGAFDDAANIASRLDASAHPHAALVSRRVAEAATRRDPNLVAHLPPFALDPKRSELLRRSEAAGRAAIDGSASDGSSTPPAAKIELAFVVVSGGARPDVLAATVRAIRAQSSPQTDVIVVGKGGAPPGARFMEAQTDAEAGRLGAMRNAAIAEARGTHVVVLDDDVVLAPDWRRRFEEAAAARPNFDLMTSQVRLPDGGRYWDHATFGGPKGHRILDADVADDHVYATGGGGFVVAKRAFERVGYDATRGYYEEEDLDFAARFRAAGFRIEHAHACVVWHADPTYTTVGRSVHRRQERRDVAAVLAPLATAPATALLSAGRAHLAARRTAEGADVLRYGRERFRDDPRFESAWRALENAHGGPLSDARWFAGFDPAFVEAANVAGLPLARSSAAALA